MGPADEEAPPEELVGAGGAASRRAVFIRSGTSSSSIDLFSACVMGIRMRCAGVLLVLTRCVVEPEAALEPAAHLLLPWAGLPLSSQAALVDQPLAVPRGPARLVARGRTPPWPEAWAP